MAPLETSRAHEAGKTMARRKEKSETGETREMTETGERSVSFQDVDHGPTTLPDQPPNEKVKNRIEHCLMLHMNKKQTMETLWKEEKIERVFTETVWERLQRDNPDFFMVYHVRLLLKEQIFVFNMLLEKQANSMGFSGKSVCGRCGTALLHRGGATVVRCAICSTIISVPPQGRCGTALLGSSGYPSIQAGASDLFPAERMGIPEKIPDHDASTSLAAQHMPSNANPLSAITYGGSSGNPNIQVGAGDLFPTERMGVPGKFPDHATGHASTCLAAQYMPSNVNPLGAIKYGESSGNPNIQVGAGDLFPAARMGIPGKIPEHATGHASTSLAAEYVPSDANPFSAIKYGIPSGHPNIHVGADAMLPAGRSRISTDILETEASRMQISHEVTGTANNSDSSFLRNSGSGGDEVLTGHSTGDAGGASSHQFEMSGKPSAELPLDADTSFKFDVPQALAEQLPDIDGSLFGSSNRTLDTLTEFWLEVDTDLSGLPRQIPELPSFFDLKSDEHATTSPGTDGGSSSVIPDGSSGHQRIQEDSNASVPAHGLSISTSMLATENSNTGTLAQVIDTTNMTDHGYLNNSGSTFSTDINHSGAAPEQPFQKLEMAEQPYDTTFELENQIPNILRFSDSTTAVQSSMMHHPPTPPKPDYVPDADNSLRSIIHGMPPGNQKVQVGTGECISTGSLDGSTSVQAKENAKTGNFQEVVNKTVPRSPNSLDILFPPSDNFSRKGSTGHAPRTSLGNCSELAGQPFSESPSGVDAVTCDTLNKNPLSSILTESTCAGISLSFSHDGRVDNNCEGIICEDPRR